MWFQHLTVGQGELGVSRSWIRTFLSFENRAAPLPDSHAKEGIYLTELSSISRHSTRLRVYDIMADRT